jgi:methionyl-tRNA formyltransferase
MLRAYEVDLGLCTGFPWLIPAEALAAARLGIVNGHPSLLPRYRGPFPLAWAVRNGEREIGLTYHLMDAGFDTGNLLAQVSVPLADDDTEETLFAQFGPTAAELLPVALDRLARGDRGDRQEGGEYQSMFEDEYRTIDLSTTAAAVHRQVRAWGFMPSVAEFGPFLERHGHRIKVKSTSLTEVDGAERLECADGPLWIVESEPA